MKRIFFVLTLLSTLACEEETVLNANILADYLELNSALERADLVACAAGRMGGLSGVAEHPTDVFFYPISGATDFRYFEAESVADSADFSKYIARDLADEPVFNGYLWKFNNDVLTEERMGIVTYKTPGKLHVCTPIRQKTPTKPTEVNAASLAVSENGTTPSFTWADGEIPENVIYFQVISELNGDLISGTYTIEKNFTFYDTDNVVFNITDPTTTPTLEPSKSYRFTLMAVSEDNWVNLFMEQEFSTN